MHNNNRTITTAARPSETRENVETVLPDISGNGEWGRSLHEALSATAPAKPVLSLLDELNSLDKAA